MEGVSKEFLEKDSFHNILLLSSINSSALVTAFRFLKGSAGQRKQ